MIEKRMDFERELKRELHGYANYKKSYWYG